jgi:hypothetical protein
MINEPIVPMMSSSVEPENTMNTTARSEPSTMASNVRSCLNFHITRIKLSDITTPSKMYDIGYLSSRICCKSDSGGTKSVGLPSLP